MIKTFSAAWVLPMDGQLIENGEVVTEDGIIVDVRPIPTPSKDRTHLSNAVILPGLINAHTHLEYTALRGFLEDVSFFTWIRTLNRTKAHFTAEDWIVSAKLGALECLASGITTIGDNTDSGASMDAALWAGLRGRIYQEFFNIDHRTPVEGTAQELFEKMSALSARRGSRMEVGISPHATYTIRPEMFEAIQRDRRFDGVPISIHVAESLAEVQMTTEGAGPFAEMFERRGIFWTPPRVSPTRYVYDQGAMGDKTLLIHCVHQDESDIALAASSCSAIIHCPKSNAKLGAGIAPLDQWLKTSDLKLGIGTDSAVSNNSIDLFEEMRFALLLQRGRVESVDNVKAVDVLQMATSGGAAAMGMDADVGTLTPGKKADLIAVDLSALHIAPATDPQSALIYSGRASDVRLTVIGGEVCYHDGIFMLVDSDEVLTEAARLKKKISMVGNS